MSASRLLSAAKEHREATAGTPRRFGWPDRSRARATLQLSYQGAVARLMGHLTRGITNRYLDMEANGLKRRSEEAARA